VSDDVQGGAIGAPFGRGREATEAAEASSGSPRRVSWVHGRCAELAVQCVRAGGSAEMRRCANGAPMVHQWAGVRSVPGRANGWRAPIQSGRGYRTDHLDRSRRLARRAPLIAGVGRGPTSARSPNYRGTELW
jgi:hypothetical protein